MYNAHAPLGFPRSCFCAQGEFVTVCVAATGLQVSRALDGKAAGSTVTVVSGHGSSWPTLTTVVAVGTVRRALISILAVGAPACPLAWRHKCRVTLSPPPIRPRQLGAGGYAALRLCGYSRSDRADVTQTTFKQGVAALGNGIQSLSAALAKVGSLESRAQAGLTAQHGFSGLSGVGSASLNGFDCASLGWAA